MSGNIIPAGMADDMAAMTYARWLGTPPDIREPQTLRDLALKLEHPIAYFVALHNSVWWQAYVEHVCGVWTPGFSTYTTHQVLDVVAQRAVQGNIPAAKLYLEMAGVYNRTGVTKSTEAEQPSPAELEDAVLEGMLEEDDLE